MENLGCEINLNPKCQFRVLDLSEKAIPNLPQLNLNHRLKPTNVPVSRNVQKSTSTSTTTTTTFISSSIPTPSCTSNELLCFIMIRNWNPINIEDVSKNSSNTISDILEHLKDVVTIKVEIFTDKISPVANIKDKLLRFLLHYSHESLMRSKCPLDTHFLNELATKMDVDTLPSDYSRHKFETWWQEQCELLKMQLSNKNEKYVQHILDNQVHFIRNGGSLHENESFKENTCYENWHTPLKTKMRTSFDPDLEVPKLMKWFKDNNHPNRQQIQQFVNDLNQSNSRNDEKTLNFHNVTHWFKNARAAQKKTSFHDHLDNHNLESQLMGAFHNVIDSKNGNESKSKSNCEIPVESLQKDVEQNPDDKNSPANCKLQEKLPSSVFLDTNADQNFQKVKLSGDQNAENISNNNDCDNKAKNETATETDCNDNDSGNNKLHICDRLTENSVLSKQYFVRNTYNDSITVNNNQFSFENAYYVNNSFLDPQPMLHTSSMTQYEKHKRNRTFIDPNTEVPKLEEWFQRNSHPVITNILKYTEQLNGMPYRTRYPKLEAKNVQFWFKNRRAKDKRLKVPNFSAFPNGSQ